MTSIRAAKLGTQLETNGGLKRRIGPCGSEDLFASWLFLSILPGIQLAGEVIQIFLATLDCNSTEVPTCPFSLDTVVTLKMRIQACNSFTANQQRPVSSGRELSGDKRTSIKNCAVGGGEVFHLVLRLADLIEVYVKTATGENYLFKVCRNERVKHLKERIAEKGGGVTADEQHLILKGKRLEDEGRIIDLVIEDNVVIHLVARKSAKFQARILGEESKLSVKEVDLDARIEKPSQSVSDENAYPTQIRSRRDVELRLPLHESKLQNRPQLESARQISTRHPEHAFSLEPVRDFVATEVPDALLKVVQQARSGLQADHSPVLASDGSGGTYFLKNSFNRNIAVFKPVDEEPEAVNNPRNSPSSSSGEGLKIGIQVGEGAMREVAAYILDHPLSGPRTSYSRNQEGFAGVPPTMMVRASHKAFNYSSGSSKTKVGSLQQYVHSVSNCEDMGPASFPVDEVHKISVLDMRLGNTDRNGGNILVCKQEGSSAVKLVPIDHGYCLPDKFEDCTFEWLYWSQSRVPFSKSTLMYISELDADKDISILASHGVVLRPECARVLRVATMLLRKGAAAGLTPFAIGSMMSRERFDVKSEIEIMLETAEASVSPAASENEFMDSLSNIMDKHIHF